MNILDIAKRVGTGLIRELVPGGGLLIDTVNQFLPEDKKLPPTATGDMVAQTVLTMPPEMQAQITMKQFDVEINATTQTNDTLRVMLAQDAVTPQSTRPRIALGCFWVLALSTGGIVLAWLYAVVTENSGMVKTIMDGWPFVLSLTGIFSTVVLGYFGILKAENQNKLDAANNLPTRAASVLSKLLR